MVRQAHHERRLAQPIFMIRWWAPAHEGLVCLENQKVAKLPFDSLNLAVNVARLRRLSDIIFFLLLRKGIQKLAHFHFLQ